MRLTRLILTNYKNYEWEEFNFHPVINCFTGLNGMGKTNLLDAIYYLSMTKSYIHSNDSIVTRFNTDFFRLEGHYQRSDNQDKIVAKVQLNKPKIFEVNAQPVSKMSSHIGYLPIVFIAPDDISMIMEGSELRRKFVDNTLAQTDPVYLTNLMLYNRILFQRNTFLKQMTNEKNGDQVLLDIYDEQLVEPAHYIYQARVQFLEQFIPVFHNIYTHISGENEIANIAYFSMLSNEVITTLLKDSRKKDLFLQRTTAGIHKDDLLFTLDNCPIKKIASQGQRKSFLLSLKLAQFIYLKNALGINPILLLDDIFDKLDPLRVQSLVNHLINDFKGQIFISDTHKNRIPDILKSLGVNHLHSEIMGGKWVR